MGSVRVSNYIWYLKGNIFVIAMYIRNTNILEILTEI